MSDSHTDSRTTSQTNSTWSSLKPPAVPGSFPDETPTKPPGRTPSPAHPAPIGSLSPIPGASRTKNPRDHRNELLGRRTRPRLDRCRQSRELPGRNTHETTGTNSLAGAPGPDWIVVANLAVPGSFSDETPTKSPGRTLLPAHPAPIGSLSPISPFPGASRTSHPRNHRDEPFAGAPGPDWIVVANPAVPGSFPDEKPPGRTLLLAHPALINVVVSSSACPGASRRKQRKLVGTNPTPAAAWLVGIQKPDPNKIEYPFYVRKNINKYT
nr:uncharacterized protein LOC115257062 [Aedes albopictus]